MGSPVISFRPGIERGALLREIAWKANVNIGDILKIVIDTYIEDINLDNNPELKQMVLEVKRRRILEDGKIKVRNGFLPNRFRTIMHRCYKCQMDFPHWRDIALSYLKEAELLGNTNAIIEIKYILSCIDNKSIMFVFDEYIKTDKLVLPDYVRRKSKALEQMKASNPLEWVRK